MSSVRLKTDHSVTLKTCFDVINELTSEQLLHFEFRPDGLLVDAMDPSHSCITQFFLNKVNLEQSGSYNYEGAPGSFISCYVNSPYFCKVLKSLVGSGNELSIFYSEVTRNSQLHVMGRDRETRELLGYAPINLTQPPENIEVVPTTITVIAHRSLVLDCETFQALIKDLSGISTDWARFHYCGGKLCLTVNGGYGSVTRIIPEIEASEGEELKNQKTILFAEEEAADPPKPICNDYNVKFILQFMKAHKVNAYLQMGMARDVPIVVQFPIPHLGLLQFFLAPRQNAEDNDEEYYSAGSELPPDDVIGEVATLVNAPPLPAPQQPRKRQRKRPAGGEFLDMASREAQKKQKESHRAQEIKVDIPDVPDF